MTRTKKTTKKTHETQKKAAPFSLDRGFAALLGVLTVATVFLSGEQQDRIGFYQPLAFLWLLTAVSYTGYVLFGKTGDRHFHFSKLDGVVFLFFGIIIVSIFWNILPGHGGAIRPSLNMLSVWLSFAAAWFLFRQCCRKTEQIHALVLLLLAVFLAQALIGFYQQFFSIPQMLREFNADPTGVVTKSDLSIQPGTPQWELLKSRVETATPVGTYSLSNSLGGLLATGVVLMLALILIQSPLREQGKSFRPGLRHGLCGILLAAFIFTKCRSGFVAIGVGVAILAVSVLRRLDRRWSRLLLGFGLVMVLLVGLVAVMMPGKDLIGGAKRSLGFRLEYWQATTQLIADYPLFGAGYGNFKTTYTKYKLPYSSEEISDPHHFLFDIAANAGVFAALLFAGMIGTMIVCGLWFRITNIPDPIEAQTDTAMYWSGGIGFLLAFLFSFGSEASIDVENFLIGLGSLPIVYLTCRKFIERQSNEAMVFPFSVALLCLLVHLSAAGGIAVSSCGILVWCFAALIANERFCREVKPFQSVYAKGTAVLVLLSVLVCEFVFSLQPVMAARALQRSSEETCDWSKHIALLESAVKADPYSVEIREELAVNYSLVWDANPNDASWRDKTLQVQRRIESLAPRSASLRLLHAERLLYFYDKTKDMILLQESLTLYKDATERYPNHAKFHAPYALALKKAGKSAEAQAEAAQARHLDDIMPHHDQKLPVELRRKIDQLQ